jgi:hypothetical protein
MNETENDGIKWRHVEVVIALLFILAAIICIFTPLFPISLPVLAVSIRTVFRALDGH